MKLSHKFLLKPGKTARKLKLKDWDPDYDPGRKREDMESEFAHFSSQMSELQYKLFADNTKSLLIVL